MQKEESHRSSFSLFSNKCKKYTNIFDFTINRNISVYVTLNEYFYDYHFSNKCRRMTTRY